MLARLERGRRERAVLVHARQDEDDVDVGVVDHRLGAEQFRVEAVVRRGAAALALVDVVDRGDVDAVGGAEPLDHAAVRPGEDAAAAEHAEAEAHAGPRATR